MTNSMELEGSRFLCFPFWIVGFSSGCRIHALGFRLGSEGRGLAFRFYMFKDFQIYGSFPK